MTENSEARRNRRMEKAAARAVWSYAQTQLFAAKREASAAEDAKIVRAVAEKAELISRCRGNRDLAYATFPGGMADTDARIVAAMYASDAAIDACPIVGRWKAETDRLYSIYRAIVADLGND